MAKKKRIQTNGYISVYQGDEENLDKATVIDYKLEHRVMAEKMLNRKLKDNEVVHHLDSNRANNSPDNLLVLEDSQHIKLHAWLDKNIVIPKPKYAIRKLMGCIRCKTCETPINEGMKYCSVNCNDEDKKSKVKPDKETLLNLVLNNPMTSVGKLYKVSDNAVRKWCKSYDITLDNRRGYWSKKTFGKI